MTTDRAAAGRARFVHRCRIAMVAFGLLLSGCTSATRAATANESLERAAAELAFERHEVMIGAAERQTVVTGFLLGGAVADLAAISIDGSGEPHLRIFAGDDGWTPALDATLHSETVFVDVATIDGRDRLLAYAPGRLSVFDPDSRAERELVRVETSYNASPRGLHYGGAEAKEPFDEGEIPRVDITRDLDGDGRDDLVLPDVDGFWIATQRRDGSFTEPVKLGPPEPFRDAVAWDETRTYGQVGITPLTAPWYLSRVHRMDRDRDGRTDLVFWNEDRFEVYRQDASGQFSPVAETFNTEVPFDADGAYSLLFEWHRQGALSLVFGGKKLARTVLHSIRDIDGDRVADLVTLTFSGRSLLRLRKTFEVHYGTPTADGIHFAPEPSAAIRPRARAPVGYSSQWLEDIDGDGRVDLVHGHVKTGVGGMIRALVGRSITLRLLFFRSQDGGIYPDEPTTARKFKADISFRGGRDAGFWPAVLIGDVDGDRRSDVVAAKSREELHVFLGVPGPEALVRKPLKIAVAVPGDERNSWLVDLDRDGKQDILMHHPSATEPHRVILLVAR